MIDIFETSESIESVRKSLQAGHVVVVKNFFSEEFCTEILLDLKQIFLQAFNVEDSENVDEFFNRLFQSDSKYKAMALACGRDLPSYYRMISSEKLQNFLRQCMDSECLLMPSDWFLFRIDGKATKEGSFNWHQDYLYNMLSYSALTFWIPLTELDESMGGLAFAPNETNEIFPVTINSSPAQNNPNRLPIDNLQTLSKKWESDSEKLNQASAGDLVLFDARVVHRSLPVTGDKFRFVVNGRIGDALDKDLIARDFYVARAKYPYLCQKIHPELVTSE